MQQVQKLKGKRGNFDHDKQPLDETRESFINFIKKFWNSPHTKKAYTNALRRYLRYCNSPDVRKKIGIKIEIGDNTDLLLFENYDGTEKDRTRFISNLISKYLTSLNEESIAPNTSRHYYEVVKRFYSKNEVILNWDNIRDSLGTTSGIKSPNIDEPYVYEEIHRILSKCDERERVIVLLLASTGMRRGAVPLLKCGDLEYIEQYGIYEITVYKGFPKDEYTTYCSLECAEAINSYLDFRKRYGERITKDSYLIRKQFVRNHRTEYLKKNKSEVPDRLKTISLPTDPPQKHKITEFNIQYIVYQLIRDAGIRDNEDKKTRVGDRYKNMAAHAFRKFFENKCLESGINIFYVSVLMGHKEKGIGVERHYYRPDSIQGENSLLELYIKKAMPFLTISEEERLKLKNRELEMRMKEDEERFKRALDERDSKYSKELSKYDTLQKQIEELTKRVGG